MVQRCNALWHGHGTHLVKKESGTHVSVCLDVANLECQSNCVKELGTTSVPDSLWARRLAVDSPRLITRSDQRLTWYLRRSDR